MSKVKTGRWLLDKRWGTECSECGFAMFELIGRPYSEAKTRYCPFCGAKMQSTMGQLKPQEPINEPSEPEYTITCADAPMTYTCDRSVCMENEYNGIDCDECEVRK